MRRALAALLLCACNSPAPGTEGADCPNDNNCIAPLRCVDGKCAVSDAPRDSGPRPDTGMPPVDAGDPDTGVEDTGEPDTGMDAGPMCPVPPMLTAIQAQLFGANGAAPCNQAACHGVGAPNIDLTQPLAQLHAALLGPTEDNAAPEPNLVVPGDPDNSRLYVIMSQDNPAGTGDRMPPSGLLDACSQETVRLWIANGAPEN